MTIKKQLSTLILSEVIDYYITGNRLHVILEPKGIYMVNRLVTFTLENESFAGEAMEILHEMVCEHEGL